MTQSEKPVDLIATKTRRGWLGPLWLELCLFVLIAGIGTTALLAASPTGTRWLFGLIEKVSAGSLQVQQVEGTLLGDITLHGIRLDTTTAKLQLDRATLHWRPGRLLAGRLDVQSLQLGQLQIHTKPSTEPSRLPASLTLPLALDIAELGLAKLTVDEQVVLSAARLTVHSDGDLHQIRLLQADTPWFAAQGSARLQGERPFKLTGQFGLLGEAEGVPWRVDMQLSDSLAALRIKGKGAGGPRTGKPFSTDFDLAIDPFSPSSYGLLKSGYLATEAMDLRAISTKLPRTALDIRLAAKPLGAAVLVDLDLRNPLTGNWQTGRLPLGQISTQWLLNADAGQIKRFDATLAGGQLSLTGSLSRKQLDLAATLRKLDAAAFGGPVWPVSGKLQLKGSPDQPRLLAQLGDASLGLNLDASLAGKGETLALQAKTLTVRAGDGVLNLTGQLGLAGKQQYSIKGDARGFDPARLSGWLGRNIPAGNLNADLQVSGQLAAQAGAKLNLALLASRFNGQPLMGHAQGEWHGQHLKNVQADITLGSNRLAAHGGFGGLGDRLQLDLQLPEVGYFGPGFHGKLDASLAISGTLQHPLLAGTAHGEALRLPGNIALVQANLQAKLDASPDHPANSPLVLKLDIAGLTAPQLDLASAQLSLSGTQAAHKAELLATGKAVGRLFDLRLQGAGSLEAQGWHGQIDQLENKGEWPLKLHSPAQLALGSKRASLTGLDANLLGTQLLIQRAEWQSGHFSAQGDIRDFALHDWLARLPDWQKQVVTDLVLSAKFDLRGDDKLAGSLVLARQSGDLALTVDDNTIKPMPLKLSQARAQLDLSGDKASVAVALVSDAFGSASAKFGTRFERTADGWQPANGATLDGRIQAEMPSLAWLGPLLGPTAKVEGKLSADITASGIFEALSQLSQQTTEDMPLRLLNEMHFFGKLDAQDFALRLPESGINWREGKLAALLEGDKAQLAAFSLKGGKGTATASGKMSLQEAKRQGALAVKFDHFGVLTRPDRNLVVSGEANLALQGIALSLTGKLTADEGRIERPKADAPVLGDDVIVKGRQETSRRRVLVIPLTVRLDLDLGQKFVFKGEGVDARVSGLVRVAASPVQSFSASGALKVEEGKYAAYGQNLAITHGIITFQGPLDNPALDVIATRKNLPVEVGVKVSGTALAPRVALTSDTAMADPEKLSWLVLGRSSASGGGDADLLLSAADALFSASDSAGIRQQVAGRLGLDDISIGRSEAYSTKTDANGNTQAGRVVSLGKRLSDRAYVSYEQSLDGVGYAVKLTYQLSRRVSLALTAGKTSAADVLYSWTFD